MRSFHCQPAYLFQCLSSRRRQLVSLRRCFCLLPFLLCFSAPAQGRGWLLISFHFHVNNAFSDKVVLTYPRALVVEIVNEHQISVLVGAFDAADYNAHTPAIAFRWRVAIVCYLVVGLHFGISRPPKTAVFKPVNLDFFRWLAFVVPFHNQLFCNILKQGLAVKDFDVERDYFQQWAFWIFFAKSVKVAI